MVISSCYCCYIDFVFLPEIIMSKIETIFKDRDQSTFCSVKRALSARKKSSTFLPEIPIAVTSFVCIQTSTRPGSRYSFIWERVGTCILLYSILERNKRGFYLGRVELPTNRFDMSSPCSFIHYATFFDPLKHWSPTNNNSIF